ncbi:MAG: hypothetical protein M3Z04_04920 [Chloroflexota bacterium]|nr:hypothetical protein [Chloroflexota bacterium]
MDSVIRWLEENKSYVVAQIVERIYAELPDYRQRSLEEMTAGAAVAYDQWCSTVAHNDLLRHASQAQQVIQRNIAHNYDPAQIARVPAIICEVVLTLLNQAGGSVYPIERILFQTRAQRMTAAILGVGEMKIAGNYLQKTMGDSGPAPAASDDPVQP